MSEEFITKCIILNMQVSELINCVTDIQSQSGNIVSQIDIDDVQYNRVDFIKAVAGTIDMYISELDSIKIKVQATIDNILA